MAAEPDLEGIQRFVLAAVSHEEGLEAGLASAAARAALAGLEPEDLIAPSAELSARERLRIYADMYYLRLVDVLAEDFERLRRFLGPEEFDRQARAYVHRHPSRRPNLQHLGAGFADFLRDEAEGLPMRAVAVDIARLERSFSRVFDAPEDETIGAEDLAGLAAGDWTGLVLEPVRALEVLALEHDILSFLDADMPAATPPERRRCFVLVHRRDYQVFRTPLGAAEAELLAALIAGRTLVRALAAAAEAGGFDPEDPGPVLSSWFRNWTALGLFRAISRRARA